MMKYDPEIAKATSEATFAPLSDTGNRPPKVHFEVSSSGRFMTAFTPCAQIDCSLGDRGSCVRIGSNDGTLIAHVQVFLPICLDYTKETIAIATALYWSWWQAEDMDGRTHE